MAPVGPPSTISHVVLLGPYGFGNESWPCVTMCAGRAHPRKPRLTRCCPSAPDCGAAAVDGERAFVMPGTEVKYTEPVELILPALEH